MSKESPPAVRTDDLDPNAIDQLVAITKGATGLAPLVGGLLGEIISVAIPNQRTDRIVLFLRELEKRINFLEADQKAAIREDPERIDLIEEGGYQAARATTDARVERIAETVFNGLKAEQSDLVRRKRLLALLGQIDEDEVALLNAYGQSYGGDAGDAWDKVNRPDPAHLQSSTEEIDREKLFEAGVSNLVRLGLLEKKYSVKRGQAPEFDAHKGDFKHRIEVSYLGRLLLRVLGMPCPIDIPQIN